MLHIADDPASRYAAGSLWLTLGRLNASLGRLFRPPSESLDITAPETTAPACLNLRLRLTADAWQCSRTASGPFDKLETLLDRLKAGTARRPIAAHRPPRLLEYYLMAQALYDLQQALPSRP
ncbi:MAG: hypothetical protein LBV79_03130 [Candidatus Adiutrix sp.]|jgi:hypothetical protein|nr:hypothetical protein [Candidatus Adiutrix sp.]